jgi:hypothetical protein
MPPFAGPVGYRGNGIVVEPLHEMEVRNVGLNEDRARLHAVLRVSSPLPNNSVILVYPFVDLLVDEGQERAALLEAVRGEIEPTIHRYRTSDVVSFPMFAHIAVATR